MFFVITMHYTATLRIPPTSVRFKTLSIQGIFTIKHQDLTPDLSARLRTLHTQRFRTTLPPSLLPPLLARRYPLLIHSVPSRKLETDQFFPNKSRLQPVGPSSGTRRGCVRVSSIAQDSSLLPPVGVWAVSQSQCGGSSSQTP